MSVGQMLGVSGLTCQLAGWLPAGWLAAGWLAGCLPGVFVGQPAGQRRLRRRAAAAAAHAPPARCVASRKPPYLTLSLWHAARRVDAQRGSLHLALPPTAPSHRSLTLPLCLPRCLPRCQPRCPTTAACLQELGGGTMQFLRIDGSTSLEDRETAIQRFNAKDSEAFIFLLSIRWGRRKEEKKACRIVWGCKLQSMPARRGAALCSVGG